MRTLIFIVVSTILFASCGNKTLETCNQGLKVDLSTLNIANSVVPSSILVTNFDKSIKAGTPLVRMSQQQLKDIVLAYKTLAFISSDGYSQLIFLEKAGSISGEAHFNEDVKVCFESAFRVGCSDWRNFIWSIGFREKLAELHYTYAFINDAKLKQFDIARQEYQLLITDFSTSFWAEQAKMALEVLGKTDEEILAAFKAKNKM